MEKRKSSNFMAKEKTVAEIEEKIKNAKSIVFIDYKGINVKEDTDLRNKFRDSNVDYKVYKNRLVNIALKNLGITGLDGMLKSQLSAAFSYNSEVDAAKIIKEANFEKKVIPQFGLIGQSVLSKEEVENLASMPSKEVLIAKLLGLIQSGAAKLAGIINAPAAALTRVIAMGVK